MKINSTAGFARLFLKLFLTMWLALFALPQYIHAQEVRVKNVVDGDTIHLSDGRSLRLAGIDTPELGHGKDKDQYYAREAKDFLQKLVASGVLRLRSVSHEAEDRHKRLVAEALLPDGKSVNELMVAQGFAYAYWHKNLQRDFWQSIKTAQQEALRTRQGMWKFILHAPINKKAYVGNKNSQRFFPVPCPNIDDIKRHNRVSFDSLEDAFAAGYAPVRICPFWPEE